MNVSRVMARFVRLPDGDVALDDSTGLVWELRPSPDRLSWPDAVRAGDGWRLPGIAELMGLLATLPDDHPFAIDASDGMWWSSSESPFAPATWARAVSWPAPGRPSVVLREKAATAARWRIRT